MMSLIRCTMRYHIAIVDNLCTINKQMLLFSEVSITEEKHDHIKFSSLLISCVSWICCNVQKFKLKLYLIKQNNYDRTLENILWFSWNVYCWGQRFLLNRKQMTMKYYEIFLGSDLDATRIIYSRHHRISTDSHWKKTLGIQLFKLPMAWLRWWNWNSSKLLV